VAKLDGLEFKDKVVSCVANVCQPSSVVFCSETPTNMLPTDPA